MAPVFCTHTNLSAAATVAAPARVRKTVWISLPLAGMAVAAVKTSGNVGALVTRSAR